MITLTNETAGCVPDSEIERIGKSIVPELGGNGRSCTSPSFPGDDVVYDDSIGKINGSGLRGFIKVNGDVIAEVYDDGMPPKASCEVKKGIA